MSFLFAKQENDGTAPAGPDHYTSEKLSRPERDLVAVGAANLGDVLRRSAFVLDVLASSNPGIAQEAPAQPAYTQEAPQPQMAENAAPTAPEAAAHDYYSTFLDDKDLSYAEAVDAGKPQVAQAAPALEVGGQPQGQAEADGRKAHVDQQLQQVWQVYADMEEAQAAAAVQDRADRVAAMRVQYPDYMANYEQGSAQ